MPANAYGYNSTGLPLYGDFSFDMDVAFENGDYLTGVPLPNTFYQSDDRQEMVYGYQSPSLDVRVALVDLTGGTIYQIRPLRNRFIASSFVLRLNKAVFVDDVHTWFSLCFDAPGTIVVEYVGYQFLQMDDGVDFRNTVAKVETSERYPVSANEIKHFTFDYIDVLTSMTVYFETDIPLSTLVEVRSSLGREFNDDAYYVLRKNNIDIVRTTVNTNFPTDWLSWAFNVCEEVLGFELIPGLSLGLLFGAIFGCLLLKFLLKLFM